MMFSVLLWCFGIRKPVLKKICTFFSDKKNHSKKALVRAKKCSDEKNKYFFLKGNLVIEPLPKSQHLTPSELRETWICIFMAKSGRNSQDHGYGMSSPFKGETWVRGRRRRTFLGFSVYFKERICIDFLSFFFVQKNSLTSFFAISQALLIHLSSNFTEIPEKIFPFGF